MGEPRTMNAQPSYKKHDPKGWCGDPKRGAAMGRHSYHPEYEFPNLVSVKLTLRKISIDSGGYDPNGTYFGTGFDPIYWYANEECTIDDVLRAPTRTAAKQLVRERYPHAKFYR